MNSVQPRFNTLHQGIIDRPAYLVSRIALLNEKAAGVRPVYGGGFHVHRAGLTGGNWLCFAELPDRRHWRSCRLLSLSVRPEIGFVWCSGRGQIGFVLHICPVSRAPATPSRRAPPGNWLRFAQSAPTGGLTPTGAPISGHRGQIGFVLHICALSRSSAATSPAAPVGKLGSFCTIRSLGLGRPPEIGFVSQDWVRFARMFLGVRCRRGIMEVWDDGILGHVGGLRGSLLCFQIINHKS
jgi:hypothetical protein